MQSEEFDKKIIEAAEHHHPAYDENAWEKMEKLLDKHLPQKKDDKRRGIFFLLLFLLLGGSIAFLIINKPRQAKQLLSKEQSLIQEKNSNNKSENSIPEKVVQTAAPEIGDIRTSTTSNEKILLSSPVSKNKNILHGQTRHSDVFNNKISESDKTFSIAANNPTADVSKPSALI
ncbi:MAG: hypothetical protein JJE22_18880, partial [Bacteroidia bacterium]|nr:hypothetical protein [Bacteroidia bacterium]